MPYFNIGLGINPMTLGIVLMILQAWNAILDPIIGNLSDNTRTRWGRRRPFMMVGAVATAVIAPWLWRPPHQFGETVMVIYLVLVGLVFYSCFSCWGMAYYGMQLELTPNYDERTRLSAWIAFFGKITTLIGGWAMAVASSSWFANPETGEPDIVRGMKFCSWFIAVMILVSGLLPALFVKERFCETDALTQKKESLLKSIAESFQCRPLWMLNGIAFFVVVGSHSIANLAQYINIYYICGGDLAMSSMISGWKSSAMVVTGLLCIPLYTWLGERFDKKSVLGWMIGASMFGHALNYFLMTPEYPYLQIISGVFESCAFSSIWLFLPSMKADVADWDELSTTRRREGALNAFFSWFVKAALTCSMGLGGAILQYSGFDVNLADDQPPEVLHTMLMLFVIIPLVVWGFSLVFVILYPLSRNEMFSIRNRLEVRRGPI